MMTTKDKVARRKLSLLELAAELSNVSRACKLIGYSRQQFYEIRRNFQTYGADGLIDRLPGAKGPHPNRVPAEIGPVTVLCRSSGRILCSKGDEPWAQAGRINFARVGFEWC